MKITGSLVAVIKTPVEKFGDLRDGLRLVAFDENEGGCCYWPGLLTFGVDQPQIVIGLPVPGGVGRRRTEAFQAGGDDLAISVDQAAPGDSVLFGIGVFKLTGTVFSSFNSAGHPVSAFASYSHRPVDGFAGSDFFFPFR